MGGGPGEPIRADLDHARRDGGDAGAGRSSAPMLTPDAPSRGDRRLPQERRWTAPVRVSGATTSAGGRVPPSAPGGYAGREW